MANTITWLKKGKVLYTSQWLDPDNAVAQAEAEFRLEHMLRKVDEVSVTNSAGTVIYHARIENGPEKR